MKRQERRIEDKIRRLIQEKQRAEEKANNHWISQFYGKMNPRNPLKEPFWETQHRMDAHSQGIKNSIDALQQELQRIGKEKEQWKIRSYRR